MIIIMKQSSAAPTGCGCLPRHAQCRLAIAFGRGPRQGGCVSGRCAGRTAAPLPTDLVAAGAVAAASWCGSFFTVALCCRQLQFILHYLSLSSLSFYCFLLRSLQQQEIGSCHIFIYHELVSESRACTVPRALRPIFKTFNNTQQSNNTGFSLSLSLSVALKALSG